MSTVDFSKMSDAELNQALYSMDREKFPENFAAAKAELARRQAQEQQVILTSANESHVMEFRGNAGTYFRIWIVNTLLTLITLGIYSAWAKVRTRRYMLGSTYLNNSNFDYHADPKKILMGRIVVGIFAAGYFFSQMISPFLSLALALIWAGFFPWLLVRGSIFNLTNTSYRNIRFGFKKDYQGAYRQIGWVWVIGILTFGIGFVYLPFALRKFKLNSTSFGTSRFTFTGRFPDFLKIYVKAFFLQIAAVVCVLGFVFVFSLFSRHVGILIGIFAFYGMALVSFTFVEVRQQTLTAQKTRLDQVSFKSSMETRELLWIYVSNIIASLVTLGLAIPWAVIRIHKYKISKFEVSAPIGSFEQFQAAQLTQIDSAADAAVDFWDIDIGL